MVNRSALFNCFEDSILMHPGQFFFLEYNSDSVVDTFNCKCNIFSEHTIGMVMHVPRR